MTYDFIFEQAIVQDLTPSNVMHDQVPFSICRFPAHNKSDVRTLPPYLVGLVLFLYIMGVFLHYMSDAQKYYILQNKKGLIDYGLFSRTRNPNYLGEILIYVSYAIISLHWLPFAVLGCWVFGFFARNMIKKDKSMSRYSEWKEYKKRVGCYCPNLFE